MRHMTPNVDTPIPLRKARVHEACGPGAASFAAVAAARVEAVLWVREVWQKEVINPAGLSAFFDPSQLLLARTNNQTETLAVAEDALRDGAVPLVVMETSRPLNLREGRRLQLAAKAGQTTGLCLTPEGMGSNAAETRWRCAPVFAVSDSTLMRWEIIKNKSGTLRVWHVRWDAEARRLHMVPPAGE